MVNFCAVCDCCTRTDIVREHLEDTNTVFNPVHTRQSDVRVDKNVACLRSLYKVPPSYLMSTTQNYESEQHNIQLQCL
jgi:hypothetical protein